MTSYTTMKNTTLSSPLHDIEIGEIFWYEIGEILWYEIEEILCEIGDIEEILWYEIGDIFFDLI